MAFNHKKLKYENIYHWTTSGKGTCFYCYKDKPVALELVGEKGICQECLDSFEIVNLATDRHVVNRILPVFNDYKEAIQWFKERGSIAQDEITEVGEDKIYLCSFYSKDGVWTKVDISENGDVHIVY